MDARHGVIARPHGVFGRMRDGAWSSHYTIEAFF
jgi:hypothetical protein